jgi:hypothetical protein
MARRLKLIGEVAERAGLPPWTSRDAGRRPCAGDGRGEAARRMPRATTAAAGTTAGDGR